MLFVNAHGVSKSYDGVLALDNFNLSVNEGEVVALLGPNGAGKTTFVKAMLGLVSIDRGSIELMGKPHTDITTRSQIAYLPERFHFYKFERVHQVLRFFALARGLDKKKVDEAIDSALNRVGIIELKDRKMGKLSKGQTQRVGLASLLMGDIKAMVLDEPFSGIDPIASKELKSLLLVLKSEGITLFINSHILSEMEKICDHVTVLNKGRCLASGNLASMTIKQSLEDTFYELIKGDGA
jgi:ABC-2 type transport system ATP-binding protein